MLKTLLWIWITCSLTFLKYPSAVLLPLTFWCIALHLQWLLLQRAASNSKNVQCIGFKSHLVFTCWENARQSVIFFVSCPTQNGRYPQTIWDYWVQIHRTGSISIFPTSSRLIFLHIHVSFILQNKTKTTVLTLQTPHATVHSSLVAEAWLAWHSIPDKYNVIDKQKWNKTCKKQRR